jgi:hypothetical protein
MNMPLIDFVEFYETLADKAEKIRNEINKGGA